MILVAVAYDPQKNLGAAYDQMLERARDEDWVCFLDHDATFVTPDWHARLSRAIASAPRAGLFTAVTNRIGNRRQLARGAPAGHDMAAHERFAARRPNAGVVDVTRGPWISGVVLAISKRAWRKAGGFAAGFFGVDNRIHRDVARAGFRVYLLENVYVYHWYRGDGDTSWIAKAPRAAWH